MARHSFRAGCRWCKSTLMGRVNWSRVRPWGAGWLIERENSAQQVVPGKENANVEDTWIRVCVAICIVRLYLHHRVRIRGFDWLQELRTWKVRRLRGIGSRRVRKFVSFFFFLLSSFLDWFVPRIWREYLCSCEGVAWLELGIEGRNFFVWFSIWGKENLF